MDYEEADPGRAFYKLKESIASLMVCWCALEDAVAAALSAATGSPIFTGSFAEQLAEWKALLEVRFQGKEQVSQELSYLIDRIDRVRRRRNLIVHGLSGVCSDPLKGEPHITCRDRHDRRSHIKVSQSELTDLMEEIQHCKFALERLASIGRLSSSQVI